MWISLGSHAGVALVFAQTDPALGHRGVTCFLVDTAQDGFRPTPIEHKMGLNAVDTSEIALDDVWAPDDAVLGEIGQGFKIAMTALDSGRFSVASGCVGVCRACLEESVKYSQERVQFDRPIASFQLVQQMIAEMRMRTDAARLLVWRAGWMKDTGAANTTETSIAKLYASEAAVWCANEAIQLHGGAGYADDHPVERHFRDVRVTTLYEGTSQIQKLIIGRAETGINALA
jgi:alkylation response protein AidB-like acyl-CoA dehydrogenase